MRATWERAKAKLAELEDQYKIDYGRKCPECDSKNTTDNQQYSNVLDLIYLCEDCGNQWSAVGDAYHHDIPDNWTDPCS